jgi:Amt family ammonium transporter
VVGAIISNIAVSIKQKSSLDDTLDVFPCHGIGGMVGMLLTGIFANQLIHGIKDGPQGWFYGNFSFFLIQAKAMLIVVVYSFTVSLLIFKFVDFILPIRVSAQDEEEGLDASQHDEKYVQGTLLVSTEYGLEEKQNA